MTIDTSLSSIPYQGDGQNRNWPIPFPFTDTAHIKVYLTNRSVSPSTTVEVSANDYEIDEQQNLTYPKSNSFNPIASTRWITIRRVVPVIQDVSFLEQSGYFMEDLENTTDYSRYIDQQLTDDMTRCVKVPVGSNVTPESYLETIENAVSQAEAAATLAQGATIAMPAVLFKEVFGIGGTNPFNILQSHNGNLAKASLGVGGLEVNLPQMSTLNFPYQVAIKRISGNTVLNINAFAGDTIEGNATLSITDNGQTVIFVADDDTLLGTWSIITAGATGATNIADGSLTTIKYADDSVTEDKIADEAITNSKLGTSSVTNIKLGDNSVTSAKIANGQIDTTHLDDGFLAIINNILFQDVISFSNAGSPYTVNNAHKNRLINIDTTGGAVTLNLGSIATLTPPYALCIRRSAGSGTITINADGTDTINGNSSFTLSGTVGNAVMFVADFTGAGINTWSTLIMGVDATISDGSIATAKLADNAVTTAKITDANITTAKLADSSVTNAKIGDNSVSTAKYVDASITTAKIANGAIGLTQLSTVANALFDGILGAGVQAYNNAGSPYALGDAMRGNVLNIDTSGGAVSLTLPQISASTSPYAFIVKRIAGTNAITLNRSSTNTFNGASNTSYTLSTVVGNAVLVIADFSGTTAGQWTTFSLGTEITAGSITATELASNAVTTAKINNSAVTTAKIATQAVTTNEIADAAVGLTQMTATANSYISSVPFGAVETISATITLTEATKGTLYNVTSTATTTITLPTISGTSVPLWYMFRRQSGSATVTITASGGNTINGTATLGTTAGNWIWIVADHSGATAGNWYIMS